MRLIAAASVAFFAAIGTASASSFADYSQPAASSHSSIMEIGDSSASSIQTIGDDKSAPDIVAVAPFGSVSRNGLATAASPETASALASADPADPFVSITPSILAMAEPAAPVSDEEVAAIDDRRAINLTPMVIRGGIVGDPYTEGSGSAPAAPPPMKASAPRPMQAAAGSRPRPPGSSGPEADAGPTNAPEAPPTSAPR